MNVKEAALRFKVSSTAIYNQLNKLENKGRQGKNGTITDEGMAFLESIYSTSLKDCLKVESERASEAEKKLAAQDHEIELLTVKLKAAEQLVESLQEKLQAATAQHEKELQAASDQHAQDQAAIDHLRGTVEAQTATIQAQAMTAAAQTATIQAMQQRLPAAPQTLRQAIAGWISSKRKGS